MNEDDSGKDGPPKRPIYFENNWILGVFTVVMIFLLWFAATYLW